MTPSRSEIREALFWKHLSDSLLDELRIEREQFYDHIQQFKEVWDEQGMPRYSEEIRFEIARRTSVIKDGFRKALMAQHAPNRIEIV